MEEYFERTRLCPICGHLVNWNSYFGLYFCEWCNMDFTKEDLEDLLNKKFNKEKE